MLAMDSTYRMDRFGRDSRKWNACGFVGLDAENADPLSAPSVLIETLQGLARLDTPKPLANSPNIKPRSICSVYGQV
jgi:hypothetical protein